MPINPAAYISSGAIVLATIAWSSMAHAQAYKLAVNPATSSLNATVAVTVRFSGSLKGNYVQGTNDAGTRTATGLIGSTAIPRNDNIPVSGVGGTGNPAPAISTKPSGIYYLKIDQAAGTVTMYALDADMIGASVEPQLPVSVSITYASFRTIAPSYTYIWFGIPIPVPLGNGTITAMHLSQDSSVSGPLAPAGAGNYTFSLQVPVTVSTDILLQGSTSTNTSQSLVTVNGTLSAVGSGPATISSTLTIPLNVSQTIPPTPGTPTPFDLPPPPGSSGANAAVILTANIIAPSSATTAGSTSLPAQGNKLSPADIADDQGNSPPAAGIPNTGVNEGDYNAFFQGFFDASPWCDIGDDQGNPSPPSTPEVPNTGVNEGDYNLFFAVFFL